MRVSFALVSSLVLAAPSAVASDLATARKLFEEGIKREEANDWSGALQKFRAVSAIRTNHIVRFHVALCLEKTGKLVDALSEFSFAKVQAEKEGGTDADLTITNARKHIDALRARIPSVQVKRPAPAALLTIDGNAALFDAAIPLDPGEHAIEVRAEGYKVFMRRIALTEGVRDPLIVDPSLEKIPVARAAPPPPPLVEPPPRDRTFAYVAGGIGVASLAAAGVFYGLRASTLSELDAACDSARAGCDPDKRALDDRGRTYTLAGNIALGVGLLTLGTAITVVVLTPRRAAVVASASAIGLRVTF